MERIKNTAQVISESEDSSIADYEKHNQSRKVIRFVGEKGIELVQVKEGDHKKQFLILGDKISR